MVKNVAIVTRPGQHDRLESGLLLTNLVDWLRGHGYRPIIDLNAVWHLKQVRTWTRPDVASNEELAATELGLVITLGGDGTILGASRLFANSGVPLLGVNLGNLGFLSEVSLADMYTALEHWEKNEHVLDSRSMVETEVWHSAGEGQIKMEPVSFLALNEAVLSQYSTGKLGEFAVELNDRLVARFRANGVIVATPTGSTAYNLAANGPIMHPDVDAMVVTPIAPHLLTLRPLVVRGDSTITVRVVGEATATLSADGQDPVELRKDDFIVSRRSKNTVNLVRLHESGFFEAMRSKMSWGER